jgi:polyisoprenoid-binding protein YceI
VETGSLVVLDPSEAEKDRKEVQATMLGERVLDATRYSQIQFTSSGVRLVSEKEGVMNVEVEGGLGLHGVERSVKVPVQVRLEEGKLSADGEFSLLQTDYGITPVKGGGGTVRVKDELKITFHLVAYEVPIPNEPRTPLRRLPKLPDEVPTG